MPDRSVIVKQICLFAPFVACVLALHIFGAGINRTFASLFAGSSYETHEAGPFRLIYRSGSPAREPTLTTLNGFMKTLSDLYPRLELHPPDPETKRIEIYLLESRDELLSLGLSVAHADLEHNGGFFQSAKLAIYLVFSRDNSWNREGLLHETTHALMHLSAPEAKWSPWLSEGMAGYFEKSLPPLPEEVGAALRSRLLPLSRLLPAESEVFSQPNNHRYYLASRLLVAFLMQSDTYSNRFCTYYIEERKPGEMTLDDFARIVGDPTEVEDRWRQWLNSLGSP